MIKDTERAFKAIGQASRLRILKVLAQAGEMCVCELQEVLGMNQPAISQHLRVLRESGLVNERKEGLWVFYSVNKEAIDGYLRAFREFLQSPMTTDPEFKEEAGRLLDLPSNPRVRACRTFGPGKR
ncbi:MAG TPA: helix-turn-helix transcriptional regulator [Clostridia bacterium]|nr:helix-turn-helix transcriptional regulator [Clostridia bacterium]